MFPSRAAGGVRMTLVLVLVLGAGATSASADPAVAEASVRLDQFGDPLPKGARGWVPAACGTGAFSPTASSSPATVRP
jgi:hypothetical protein